MGVILGFIYFITILLLGFIFNIVKLPFNYLNNFMYKHPLQTARFVVGVVVALLIAAIFELPIHFGVSFFGGFIALILGEIL